MLSSVHVHSQANMRSPKFFLGHRLNIIYVLPTYKLGASVVYTKELCILELIYLIRASHRPHNG